MGCEIPLTSEHSPVITPCHAIPYSHRVPPPNPISYRSGLTSRKKAEIDLVCDPARIAVTSLLSSLQFSCSPMNPRRHFDEVLPFSGFCRRLGLLLLCLGGLWLSQPQTVVWGADSEVAECHHLKDPRRCPQCNKHEKRHAGRNVKTI